MADKPPPILIVGQGLAGTAVAWRLWQRGARFLVVDPDETDTSSRVAAGLVTPITGMRLNLSWRLAGLLPEALAFYESVGEQLHCSPYHPTPVVRLFRNEREVKLWGSRATAPELQPWLEPRPAEPLVDPDRFHAELGGFEQRPAGWLDTRLYLSRSREFFQQEGRWEQATVEEHDLQVSPQAVLWRGRQFSHVVFCRGWQESQARRFFPWLEFDAARGVIVSLTTDLPGEKRVLNRGAWLLNRGDGTWRAGSTYDFDFQSPITPFVAEVERKLHGLLKVPFSLTGARSGVRPIIKRFSAVVGRHPAHERVAVLNGLGSKGVLRSPAMARLLVEHLLDGHPLDAEVDVRSHP